MPAGFNTGQVEYIKAIANVNAHKTYKPVTYNNNLVTAANSLTRTTADNLAKYQLFCLGKAPQVRDTTGATGVLSSVIALDAFYIPIADTAVTPAGGGAAVEVANSIITADARDGPEGFLESTHLNVRLVLPHKTNSFADDHCEIRMLVFRARDRQHHDPLYAKDVNNPYYNLFHATNNYNVGFSGYENKPDVHGDISYVGTTAPAVSGLAWVGHQDALTMPVNKQSWIVMKDHRFFLGKEYGGKNIYETTLHWDWRDPISANSSDVTDTDNDKNYTWYILFIASNNNFTSADTPEITVRMMGTTHMTSG